MGVKIKTEKNKGVNIAKFSNPTIHGRLNLNDLLKRAKEEKISDRKHNLLILSGAITVVIVFLLIITI